MAATGDDFLKLAKALRKLGATKFEALGMSVEFGPRVVAAPAQQLSLPQVPLRRVLPSQSSAAVPERLTAEKQAEIKEAAYRRELGL